MHPPFCLIRRCLAKVLKGKAEIIITPAWQTQPYYPLLALSIDNPMLLPPTQDLLLSPQGQIHPPMKTHTLKSFRRIKEAGGVSKQTSELLAAGWRKGTQTAYNSCWRQWSSWFHARQINPFHTSVENITYFLVELYARKY
jgi:hypothetical protein